MGKIDRELNHYFKDNRAFADMINLCIYDGEQVVLPQNLEEDSTVLYARDEGNNLRERRTDVSKRCANGYSYCIYCLENESKISYDMPVRNMEFEAARYREQLRRIAAEHKKTDYQSWDEFSSKFTKNDRLQPVIMLVLYWSRKPWDGVRSLTEMFDIPDSNRGQIVPFLQNYRLNLINMYELKHVESCQSQLKYALRLLQKDQSREAIYREVQKNLAYRKLDQETGRMMAILLRDEKLGQYIEKQQKDERKETFNMCKALDDMRQEAMKCGIEQGISRGIEQGIERGIEQGISRGIEQGIEQGKSVGENCFARLTNFLLTDGRLEDLRCVIDNTATRQELYREYHILY